MSRATLTLILAIALISCVAEPPAGNPTRETLPNGAVLVRYPDLPAIDSVGPEVTEARVDLRFGSRDGTDRNLTFSDIRGIQAAGNGDIYVLDYQAVEVRVFDAEGRYLRTIARGGRGPGEIIEANGILLSGDTLLWMHDHGQYMIIGVDPQGTEVRRFPKPVDQYGGYWSGTFDARGRYWREVSHRDDASTYADEGVNTNTAREYYKSYDLSSGAVDSVFLGESTSRSYSYVDAGGTGFLRMVERQPDLRRHAEAVAALMPAVKPILTGLFVDDEGRLWVERATPAEVPAFYDRFSDDGDYLGSVRLAFEPGRRIWVQHGAIHTWVADEMDIPYVVRAPLSS